MCTYKWADLSLNTGQIIFKFSTNINDMCVINFHLFYFELNKTLKNANEKFKFMVKSKFTFFQYFRRDQTRSNISQNKLNITIFLSQILQRLPSPCKLTSRYVPPHCSLQQDNGVPLTSHNAERNSTSREFLLSVDSVWSE